MRKNPIKKLVESNNLCAKKNCSKVAVFKVNKTCLCKKHAKRPIEKIRLRAEAGKIKAKDKQFIQKFAKQLEKRPTAAEVIFERKMQELGIDCEGQKWFMLGGIKGVFDFYLPKLFIVIEVDGGYHQEEDQQQTDAIKDFIAEKLGYKMLRLTNKQAIYLSIDQIKVLIDNLIVNCLV